jgi:multidrug efflux pump subunit AcrB
MCLRYLPPEKEHDPNSRKWTERLRGKSIAFVEKIDSIYQEYLRRALSHRRLVILSICGFAVLSLGLWYFVGTEFFPDQDEAQFTVNFRLPVGTRVEETDKVARQIEKIVKENVPEVLVTITDVGTASSRGGTGFGGNNGSHAGQVRVALVHADERSRSIFNIIQSLRPRLTQIAGAQVFVNPGGFLRFLLNFGSSAPIDVEIRGFDLDAGSALAQRILAIVRSTPGATDAQISRDDNLPELRIKIDRDKAGALGVNVADISGTITTCINGTNASQYTDPVSGNQYDILVRLNEDYRSNIDDLLRLQLPSRSGELVTLGNVARIERTKSPVQIDRKYQQRIIDVTANVSDRDLGSVASDIQSKINTLAVPAGFEVRVTGNVEQQSKTFRDLGLAFALAILLVYVVMASQFQSLLDPFIIMFTVPLGIVGVLWMLFLTHTTLSVNSFQGVIVMVGIVVSNGILLVDYTNRLRANGVELHDAVIKAGRTRLKPILMTSLATVLGLIPLAVSFGGESAQAPLAIAVIGGLTVSTFLTLFLVPALYTVFEERFKREIINRDEHETISS